MFLLGDGVQVGSSLSRMRGSQEVVVQRERHIVGELLFGGQRPDYEGRLGRSLVVRMWDVG